MGYSTILDIIASVVVGGLVLLVLLRTSAGAAENSYNYGQDLIVQEDVTSLAEIMEYDLRKIGYCADYTQIPDPTKAILAADSTSIKFLSDTSSSSNPLWTGDGTTDNIYYFLDSKGDSLTHIQNPNVKYLHRVIDGNTAGETTWPVTEFSLMYFDAMGDTLKFPITSTSQISSIQVTLQVQNNSPYNSNYQSALWKQFTVTTPNLSKR